MIRTKAYLLREIKKLETTKKKLEQELSYLNSMTKLAEVGFAKTKRVIRHELIVIEGKLSFAEWCLNTNEKDLPKIKDKKKKKKGKKAKEVQLKDTPVQLNEK